MFVRLDGGGGVCLLQFPRLHRLPLSRNACALPSRDTGSLLFRLCLLSPPPVISYALPSGHTSACLLRSPPPVMPALSPPVTPSLPSSGFSRNCGALPAGHTSTRPLGSRLPAPHPVTPVFVPSGNAGAPPPVMPAPAPPPMPATALSRDSCALRSGHAALVTPAASCSSYSSAHLLP